MPRVNSSCPVSKAFDNLVNAKCAHLRKHKRMAVEWCTVASEVRPLRFSDAKCGNLVWDWGPCAIQLIDCTWPPTLLIARPPTQLIAHGPHPYWLHMAPNPTMAPNHTDCTWPPTTSITRFGRHLSYNDDWASINEPHSHARPTLFVVKQCQSVTP